MRLTADGTACPEGGRLVNRIGNTQSDAAGPAESWSAREEPGVRLPEVVYGWPAPVVARRLEGPPSR
jgi:hypothetical protein